MAKQSKRTLKKILSKIIDSWFDDRTMKIILDADNVDYYLRRAMECLSGALDSTPNDVPLYPKEMKERCVDQLEKAILLLVITEDVILKHGA